jgi:DNA-binding LytR/AlgR family response regulator
MKTIKIENDILKVHIGSRKYVRPEDMIHLESDLNYTLILLKDGERILSSTTLKIIETRLHPFKNFVRINRQSVINLDWVEAIENNVCMLPGNLNIAFSRRRAKAYEELKMAQ